MRIMFIEKYLKGEYFFYCVVILTVVISGIALISNIIFGEASSVLIVVASVIFSLLGIILGFLLLAKRPTAVNKALIFYFVQIFAVDSRYFGFDFYTSGSVDLNIWFNFGASKLSIDLVALFMFVSLGRIGQSKGLASDTEKPSNEEENPEGSGLTDVGGKSEENAQFVYPPSLIRRSLLLYKPSRPWDWIKYRLPFYFLAFVAIPFFLVLALFIYFGPEMLPEGFPEVIYLVIIAVFLHRLATNSEKN